MSMRRSRAPSNSSGSPSPRIPPVPRRDRSHRHSEDEYTSPRKHRRRSRNFHHRGYDTGREKSNKVDLLFCVFHGAPSHRWRTAPFTFDRRRIDDRELWEDIQRVYQDELQGMWRRILGFKKLKQVIPIEYTSNGVPIPKDAKNNPNNHSFMHAVHHPDHIRPDHEWVDWFIQFKDDDRGKTVGLEFAEGLWAEKLAIIAIVITIAIIVVSIVWVVEGGDLQTVFTVMSFVLTGAAAEVALVALYFQVTQSN
ncbi:hypothetical protein ACLMJK_005671 [Lecanora helva]